jgi:hypothetical protein
LVKSENEENSVIASEGPDNKTLAYAPTEFEVAFDASELPPFDSEKVGRGIQIFPMVKIAFQGYQEALASLDFGKVVCVDVLNCGRDSQLLFAYGPLRKILNNHQSISGGEYDEILKICREKLMRCV